MTKLSQRAYAKHIGMSEAAVRKAIKTGRINLDQNNKINPEVADRQWSENTDPSKQRNISNNDNILTANNTSNQETVNSNLTYQKSRAVKETYEAKLRKLEYDIKSGKFIEAAKVKISAFNAARMVRDKLLNIPNQAAPMIINKSDIFEIKQILKNHITKALEELSGGHEGAK